MQRCAAVAAQLGGQGQCVVFEHLHLYEAIKLQNQGAVIRTRIDLAVQVVRPGVLEQVIPVLLILIALYFLFAPRAGEVAAHQRVSHRAFALLVGTGIGFYDHMLEQIAKHGGFSLTLECDGDLHVDDHHTIEDTAICLGEALRKALGNKRGVGRYGFVTPMDESEARAAIDLSGRGNLVFDGEFPRDSVGGFATEMVRHFFGTLADALGAAIHVEVRGENTHHMVEACFKAVGRCLRDAVRREGTAMPSTKGMLA